jgi:hypothetical protein
VTEDNLVSLLEDGRKDCSTRNPEICAASATTEEMIVFNVTKTTAVLTSTEAATVTVPILAAIVTADSPSTMNILPTSVEKETIAPQSWSSTIWGLYNRPEVATVPSGLSPTPPIIKKNRLQVGPLYQPWMTDEKMEH